MKTLGPGIAVTLVAISGAIAYSQWRSRMEAARSRSAAAPVDVTRWEGEGGNVPDVSVDAGQQAAAADGSAVLPDVNRVSTNREADDQPGRSR